MNKRKIFLVITAIILTSILSSSLSVVTVLAWPFGDVNPGDWFYNDVDWLDWNNITHGCGGGNFCPNANVTRAEMAAFLHREAGVLVSAGVHIMRGAADAPYIADWFNNVNALAPVLSSGTGYYTIDFGFVITHRYPLCTIDGGWGDTRNTTCSVYATAGNIINVYIWDADAGYSQPAEFYLLVFGQ